MSTSDENQNPLLRGERWPIGTPSVKGELASISKGLPIKGKRSAVRGSPININNNNIHREYEEEYLDIGEMCGFPKCLFPPRWLQRLATKRMFLLVFCISSVLQGMYYTYFVSVLTTIERLFQIRSQTTGIIMSATEVGQIGGGLLLSYYGGQGHRPRWIASGMLLFGFSAALCALPHFLFGDALLKEFLTFTPSQDNPLATANICLEPITTTGIFFKALHNTTSSEGLRDSIVRTCNTPKAQSMVVLGLFFVALLGVGVGQTAVFNLGIPYIDDNVASEDSPTYFGTTIGVRIFGPTLGFVLGSLCTRLPIDPLSSTKFEPTDPRWIGAWWLGHVIISCALILTSFVMLMFPKRLPVSDQEKQMRKSLQTESFRSLHSETYEEISPLTEESLSFDSSTYVKSTDGSSRPCSVENVFGNQVLRSLKIDSSSILAPPQVIDQEKGKEEEFRRFKNGSSSRELHWGSPAAQRSLKDFASVVRRLVTNQVLVLRTASSVLHLLPISGLYTFLPKYIETQFRLPVHTAAMISGVGGILVMGFGIFVSGFMIRRLNPPPRAIAAWIAITAFLYSVGMIILMFLGCSHDDVKGRIDALGTSSTFQAICERTCSGCNEEVFAPICSDEGNTYFSACHAGCKSVSILNSTYEMVFSDCECLGEGVTAKLRLCESLCPNIMWYVGVFILFVVIHSTSEVGGMLLTLRCVSPKDKAMALGLISVAVGLFGNVPCPILYGAVIDHACIHWRESCEGRGACQIYDPDIFRTFFHGTTAFVMFLAFCVDVCVWQKCKTASFSVDGKDFPQKNDNHSSFRPSEHPRDASLITQSDDMASTVSSTTSSIRKTDDISDNKQDDLVLAYNFNDNPDKTYSKSAIESLREAQFDVKKFLLRESVI